MSGVLQALTMSKKATATGITYVNVASTQNASSSTSITINKPTNTVDGDLMLMFVGGAYSGSQTWTFPAGWTGVMGTTSASGPALGVAYKVASGEGTNYTTTGTNNNKYSGHIVTYRNAAYDTIGTKSTSLTATGISVAQNNSLLIAIYMTNTGVFDDGDAPPTGMTLSYFDNDGTTPNYGTYTQNVNSGSTSSKTSTTPSTGTINSVLLSIKPV